ncbi:MAG TPA: spore coat protein [Moorella mulderi]|nr:spore coat protein [Moorella mulderi]
MPGLTEAELMSLRENLSNELLLIQKFGAYAQQCGDPQLKQVCSSIQQAHQRHFETLMRHLGGQRVM